MSRATRKQRRKGRAARRANKMSNLASTQPVTAQAPAPQETPEPALSVAQLAAYLSSIAASAGMTDASRANFDIAFDELVAEREAAKRSGAATPSEHVHPSSNPDSPPSPDPSHRGGPSTQPGKARSAQNSFKHGLSSGFTHFKLLPGESLAEYIELVADIRSQFRPGTRAEAHKLEDMAQAWWLQRRARNLQTGALESGGDKAFALYLRYETTQGRSYQMAHQDFKDMQERRKANAKSPVTPAVPDPGTFQSPRQYPSPPAAPDSTSAPPDAPNPQPLAVLICRQSANPSLSASVLAGLMNLFGRAISASDKAPKHVTAKPARPEARRRFATCTTFAGWQPAVDCQMGAARYPLGAYSD